MEVKYKEAVDKLHILEEEKCILVEEKCVLEQLNSCTITKLEEAKGSLLKSEEEKILLMKQLYQASSIALKIMNKARQSRFLVSHQPLPQF